MRLILAGSSFTESSLETFWLQGLSELDVEVTPVTFRRLPYIRGISKWGNRLTHAVERRLQDDLILETRSADAVVLVKPSPLASSTITQIRQSNPDAVVVAYIPDDPVDAMRARHFPAPALGALRSCDAVLTWTEDQRSVLSNIGVEEHDVVPFGWSRAHRGPEPSEDDPPPEFAASFIGSWDRSRESAIERLVRDLGPSRPCIVAGPGWRRSNFGPSVTVRDGWISPPEFRAVARGAAVCLNIPRPQNDGNHNMRYFELMAMGAVQMSTLQVTDPDGIECPGIGFDEILSIQADHSSLTARRRSVWRCAKDRDYSARMQTLMDILRRLRR